MSRLFSAIGIGAETLCFGRRIAAVNWLRHRRCQRQMQAVPEQEETTLFLTGGSLVRAWQGSRVAAGYVSFATTFRKKLSAHLLGCKRPHSVLLFTISFLRFARLRRGFDSCRKSGWGIFFVSFRLVLAFWNRRSYW